MAITNFEDFSGLQPFEQVCVSVIADLLRDRLGPNKALRSGAIIKLIQSTMGIKLTGAAVRHIINRLRNDGKIRGLVANSKGYYVTDDPEILETYITSLLEREGAIATTRKGMEAYLRTISQNPIYKANI